MTEPPAFWQQKPRYDGAEYDLSHLQPFDRKFMSATGRAIDTKIAFSYHCCTDIQGNRGLGTRVTEASRSAEVRFLCPVRWFLSLNLPGLMKSLDNKKVLRIPGYQWLHRERVPGISLQWAVFIKAMPGRPESGAMVAVETAYLAGAPPHGGGESRFGHIVEQTALTGRLFGDP